jgi:hypothetical protein
MPPPVPAAPAVIVSHALFEAAVHPQVGPVLTVTLPEPPAASMFRPGGASANVHGTACCVTISVCPPMTTVPLRAAASFAATENLTTPFPVPEAPSVMVIQEFCVAAVHAQPAPAVSAVEPVPPVAGKSSDAGEIENVHGAGLWVTVNVWPAIVAVPLRAAPAFAAMFRVTAPPPVPDALPAKVIHEALLADVQAQDAPADTVTVELPPSAGTAAVAGLIE